MNQTSRRRRSRLAQTAAAAMVLAAVLSQSSSSMSPRTIIRDQQDVLPQPVLIPQHTPNLEKSAGLAPIATANVQTTLAGPSIAPHSIFPIALRTT
jgi:hypothetical protein